MAETSQNPGSSSAGPPPDGYTDAPPEEERRSSYFLLLAVSVAVLAAAVLWVVHRAKTGTLQPEAGASTGTVGAGSAGGGGASTLEPRAPVDFTSDDGFGGGAGAGRASALPGAPGEADGRPGQPGRRALAPRPTLDAATAARIAQLAEAINALGPSLEVIRAVQGAYPTSKGGAGDANRGVEALYDVLKQRGALDGVSLATGDTDGDGRTELLDPWGRALVYFSNDDYGNPQQVTGDGTVEARDRWTEDTRGWQGEKRFQLFSVGPDGKDDLGGYDDVNSWVSRE